MKGEWWKVNDECARVSKRKQQEKTNKKQEKEREKERNKTLHQLMSEWTSQPRVSSSRSRLFIFIFKHQDWVRGREGASNKTSLAFKSTPILGAEIPCTHTWHDCDRCVMRLLLQQVQVSRPFRRLIVSFLSCLFLHNMTHSLWNSLPFQIVMTGFSALGLLSALKLVARAMGRLSARAHSPSAAPAAVRLVPCFLSLSLSRWSYPVQDVFYSCIVMFCAMLFLVCQEKWHDHSDDSSQTFHRGRRLSRI